MEEISEFFFQMVHSNVLELYQRQPGFLSLSSPARSVCTVQAKWEENLQLQVADVNMLKLDKAESHNIHF